MKELYSINVPCLRDTGVTRKCYLHRLVQDGYEIYASNGCDDCSGDPQCYDCGIQVRKAFQDHPERFSAVV